MTTVAAPARKGDPAHRLMAGLGYAGLLPFYAAALWQALPGLPGREAAPSLFVVYGAVILAFLGGSLWGYAVMVPAREKQLRLITSNLVALCAAGIALAASLPVAVTLLALGQVGLLVYERALGDSGGWYLRLRTRLVIAVLPAHALMLYALP